MPENVNTSALACSGLSDETDHRDVMVDVDHVTMIFNMANEQLNNLKEYAIALARRELMFKEFRALDDVSFQVKRGDVFGILGTNGSGKSTVLKIIAGVLEPSKGKCSVNGNIAPLIELGAGFDMELTARENIYLNGALLGYPKKFIEDDFNEIVEFAEVEKFLDMPMKNYSSGMVARIAFAIATVIVPEILIVDEVLSVGDFMFQKKCENRINKLIKEHGVTVLIVSHSNDQIERLCNKAVWIEKGHLRMAGSAKDVCQAYRILGGRLGSAESESVVFRALTSSVVPPAGCIETVSADSRYGMAAKLMAKCFPNACSHAILVSGERNMDAFLAMGIAGSYDCPILLTQGATIPDSTAQELQRIKPSKVLFINSGDCPKGFMAMQVIELLGKGIEIEEIYGENYEDLSLSVYRWGQERSCWGKQAIVSWVGCTGDLISMSTHMFKNACPVFLKEYDGRFSDAQYEALRSVEIKSIVALAGTTALPEADFEDAGFGDIDLVRLLGSDPYDANRVIGDWILSNEKSTASDCEWIVASCERFEFSLTLGVYVAKRGGRFLLSDPVNLDAVAMALSRISEEKANLRKLVFIGGNDVYREIDKVLLAKALS